jgi:hypothetical protein
VAVRPQIDELCEDVGQIGMRVRAMELTALDEHCQNDQIFCPLFQAGSIVRGLDLLRLIWCAFIGLFRSKASIEAENLASRQQLNVLRRKSPKRLVFQQCRSSRFRCPLSFRTKHLESSRDHSARDGYPLASPWISPVLAMEITISGRSTESTLGNEATHPDHEFGKSVVWRS